MIASALPISIKLADFHNVKWMQEENGLITQVGNTAYAAPEMRGDALAPQRYDTSVDMWSLGIVLYEILTKAHPFSLPGLPGFSENLYRQFIKNGSPISLSELDRSSTVYASSLIARMLARDPDSRPTPMEALNDPWFGIDIPSR